VDAGQLIGLRHVDLDLMTRIYRTASTDVLHARTNDTDDERWPHAAQSLCTFLDFVQTNDVLWGGLEEAVDAAEGVEADLDVTWEQLEEFTEAEFALLIRGIDQDTAGRIVYDIRERLRSRERATRADVDDLRNDIRTIQGYVCNRDFARFGDPERRAITLVNSNAILAGGGGLVATVSDALIHCSRPSLRVR
jgi:hypothetical protein